MSPVSGSEKDEALKVAVKLMPVAPFEGLVSEGLFGELFGCAKVVKLREEDQLLQVPWLSW